ncbi:MAG: csrA [Planctomycetaceae bacterium]|nr:csrA [Planctomycetaceae bacterium]
MSQVLHEICSGSLDGLTFTRSIDCGVVSSEKLGVDAPKSGKTNQLKLEARGSLPCEAGNTMLVLSRKKDESIVINDEIIITVVEVRGDKVRLGIQAPRDVPVHRSEVHAAIHGKTPELPTDSPEVST